MTTCTAPVKLCPRPLWRSIKQEVDDKTWEDRFTDSYAAALSSPQEGICRDTVWHIYDMS
jgi:hypothetical protein